MAKGDHIYVHRLGYTHHGIDCGYGTVIHYTGEVGQKTSAAVRHSSIREFAAGGKVHIKQYGRCHDIQYTLVMAKSRLYENSYNLIFNNCEHFATWCKTGNHISEQVKDVTFTSGGSIGTMASLAAGLGVVSAEGAIAGLGGAGIMSGLATVGGIVGSGAVTGIALAGVAPAAVTCSAMASVLCDAPHLNKNERDARKAGRYATIGGAAAGTAAAIGTVAASGSVAGLSAAGITSGLAAIGSVVGGGMTAGVLMTAAAPATAAAGIGYGIYKAWKWMNS
jgi:Lecithin retinol acyltransferase